MLESRGEMKVGVRAMAEHSGRVRHGGDIYSRPVKLDFSVNVNPLGAPRTVCRVFFESARELGCYPDHESRALRRLLSARMRIREDWILCGNGASELLQAAVLALHPERAILPVPSFSGYRHALCALDTVRGKKTAVTELVLKASQNFRLEEEIFELPRAELMILCLPNNPVGNLLPLSVIKRILLHCRRMNMHLLLDCCFLSLTEEGETLMPELTGLLGEFPELLLVDALTKSHALPGLRVGWLCCSDIVLTAAIRAVQAEWSVSVPGTRAAIAALTADEDYLCRSRRLIRRERAYLARGLRKIGYRVFPGSANFILFRAEEALFLPLLERGILIRSCADYAGLDEHYYRIAVRRREENRALLRALTELSNIREREHGAQD